MRTVLRALLSVSIALALMPSAAFGSAAHTPPPTTDTTTTPPPATDTTTTPPPATDTTAPLTPMVDRLAGPNRIASAIAMSKAHFEAGSVHHVVLVNGFSEAESILAPSLAGALDSPILLTYADRIPHDLMRELDRLGVERVYLVGGTKSLTTGLVNELKGLGIAVERVAGANRYATAAAVAAKVVSIKGHIDRGFIVNGDDPYPAVSAASYAYSQGFPILLTSATGVPAETLTALRRGDLMNVTVVGGTAAISSASYTALSKATVGNEDERLAGRTRFETARVLADTAIDRGWAKPKTIGIVNGMNGWSDALAASAVVGMSEGAILLVMRDMVPMTTSDFIKHYAAEKKIGMVHVLGGTAVVSEMVVHDIKRALTASGGH